MKGFKYLNDMAILRLSEDRCIGCGNCELVCPHRIFKVRDGKAQLIDRDSCMECGACAKNCPVEAIYVNPDNGCGCAIYIINNWIARFRGKDLSCCS